MKTRLAQWAATVPLAVMAVATEAGAMVWEEVAREKEAEMTEVGVEVETVGVALREMPVVVTEERRVGVGRGMEAALMEVVRGVRARETVEAVVGAAETRAVHPNAAGHLLAKASHPVYVKGTMAGQRTHSHQNQLALASGLAPSGFPRWPRRRWPRLRGGWCMLECWVPFYRPNGSPSNSGVDSRNGSRLSRRCRR